MHPKSNMNLVICETGAMAAQRNVYDIRCLIIQCICCIIPVVYVQEIDLITVPEFKVSGWVDKYDI